MRVPSFDTIRILDLQERHAPGDMSPPELRSLQLLKRFVQPIEQASEGLSGVSERESDEADSLIGHAIENVMGDGTTTLGCARSAEAVVAARTGYPVDWRIAQRLHDVGLGAAVLERGDATDGLHGPVQRAMD